MIFKISLSSLKVWSVAAKITGIKFYYYRYFKYHQNIIRTLNS